jgi:protease IV
MRAALTVLLAGVLGATGCLTVDLPLGNRGELQEKVVSGSAGPKILMLDLDGVLSEEAETGALGFASRESAVARTREQLERARDDEQVRAVLVRIQSPGGTVTASDILYHEILRFKEETHRPVIAQCMGVCASGAYYAAMAADRVLVHPTSVTGSIGVLLSSLSFAGLMDKLGVEDQTLTSGPFKDAGSPWRRMSPAERQQLQSVVDDLYARFLEVVRQGRPALDAEAVRRLADGRIYTAHQALAAGLVDGIGYLQDAVAELKERAHLEQARVVVYHRPREWSENLYSSSAAPAPRALPAGVAGQVASPAFLYLWWPGLAAVGLAPQ